MVYLTSDNVISIERHSSSELITITGRRERKGKNKIVYTSYIVISWCVHVCVYLASKEIRQKATLFLKRSPFFFKLNFVLSSNRPLAGWRTLLH